MNLKLSILLLIFSIAFISIGYNIIYYDINFSFENAFGRHPCEPGADCGDPPQDPVEPQGPQDPVEPQGPQDPVEPQGPQDPVEPQGPQDPVEPQGPANTCQPGTVGNWPNCSMEIPACPIGSTGIWPNCNILSFTKNNCEDGVTAEGSLTQNIIIPTSPQNFDTKQNTLLSMGGNSSLTIKQISKDSRIENADMIFKLHPFPFPFDFGYTSVIVKDNDGVFDSDSTVGKIKLNGIKFDEYEIQQLMPTSTGCFIEHQTTMPVSQGEPNIVINFPIKNFSQNPFEIIEDQYIVTISDNTTENTESIAQEYVSKGAVILYNYDNLFKGFAINLHNNKDLISEIRSDVRIGSVENDVYGRIASIIDNNSPDQFQSLPTGINRIDADRMLNRFNHNLLNNNDTNLDQYKYRNESISIEDKDLNVDVAVLDTGISLTHPDLNVYQNISFVHGVNSGDDDQGHGSHIAGTIAAKDNSLGVVGIIPEAKLWAVKVCDKEGKCPISSQIKGIEYVTKNADQIDVVNLSTENPKSESLDKAVNRSVSAGVTYVVAAGNSDKDTSNFSPAANPSVITVSAFGDSDGKCGGTGLPTFIGPDDSIANFSNYGSDIDVTAPGVDIQSTYNGSEYAVDSGTSQAAPHVTGIVALLKANNPLLTPSEIHDIIIKQGIQSDSLCEGNGHGYVSGTEFDGFQEPLIYLNDSTNYDNYTKPESSLDLQLKSPPVNSSIYIDNSTFEEQQQKLSDKSDSSGLQSNKKYNSNKIYIELHSASFEPLVNNSDKQKVIALVDFKVNNPDYVDSTINGIMDVYSIDGDLIKSYSYADGFTMSNSGTVEFSTLLDNAVNHVLIEIYFTDLTKTETLSNIVSTEIANQDI